MDVAETGSPIAAWSSCWQRTGDSDHGDRKITDTAGRAMRWFGREKPRETWDEAIEWPLGDIEAAERSATSAAPPPTALNLSAASQPVPTARSGSALEQARGGKRALSARRPRPRWKSR